MSRKLQIKRGEKANLPTLAQGEFGLTTDANAEELFIGNGSENIPIARGDKSLAIIDARSSAYNMADILTSGPHCAMYKTNENTLSTPYKQGLDWKRATIFSISLVNNYGAQVAFIDGAATIYRRSLDAGTISKWVRVQSESMNELLLSSGYAKLVQADGHVKLSTFFNQNQLPGSRHLKLNNELTADSEMDYYSLVLECYGADGKLKEYKIYGEHNKPTAADVGARPSTWMPTAEDVGARPNTWSPAAADVGAVPFIEGGSVDFDMDDIIKSGKHCAVYRTTQATGGTPNDYGTAGTYVGAGILSFANSATFGAQLAMIQGMAPQYRCLTNGVLGAWTKLLSEAVAEWLINNGAGKISSTTGQLQFSAYKTAGENPSSRHLRLHNGDTALKNAVRLFAYNADGTSTNYHIMGTHNKTRGTYTGNGSSAARTIDTGSLGNACIVTTTDGIMALVTDAGMIYASGSTAPTYKGKDIAYFDNGILYLKTNSFINTNNKTFTYQGI